MSVGFKDSTGGLGEGGFARRAPRARNPAALLPPLALQNLGVSMTSFELAPCAVRQPHIHQYASGMLYAIEGEWMESMASMHVRAREHSVPTWPLALHCLPPPPLPPSAADSLVVGFVQENGTSVQNTISSGASAVFPQGLVHYQFNNGCTNATYTIAYNDPQGSTVNIVPALFDLPKVGCTPGLAWRKGGMAPCCAFWRLPSPGMRRRRRRRLPPRAPLAAPLHACRPAAIPRDLGTATRVHDSCPPSPEPCRRW